MDILDAEDTAGADFRLPKTSFYDNAGSFGNHETALSSPALDIVDFLSVVQWRNIDLLPMTWERGSGADPEMIGGTANIQQSLVDLRLALACKRIHWENFLAQDAETAVQLFITEVAILGHPVIRQHTSIARLEGVCWDMEETEIRPVLVFKKAPHGDLRRFLQTDEGRRISTDVRVRFCASIAAAIMTLHSFHIIHGDVKPENVLVYEDAPGTYNAKLADFGYSTLNTTRREDEAIAMPISWPWTAPEISKEHSVLYFTQARAADCYSFGMLCLWLLFTDAISNNLEGGEDLQKLCQLKEEGRLQSFALDLVSRAIEPSNAHSQALAKGLAFFFRWTLETDPSLRRFPEGQMAEARVAFWKGEAAKNRGEPIHDLAEISHLGILYEDIQGIRLPFGFLHYYTIRHMPLRYNVEDVNLDLTELIGQLSASDFRLWVHLRSSLEKRTSEHFSESRCREASFSLALLSIIGLGLSDDDSQATVVDRWLLKSGRTRDELDAEVDKIRCADKIPYKSTNVPYESISVAEEYLRSSILEDAQKAHERAFTAVENVLGSQNVISRRLCISLAKIWLSQGLHEKAATLLREHIDNWHGTLGPSGPDVILAHNHLAFACISQGRFDEGISLQKTVVEMSTRAFGEEHKITIAATGNLAGSYWQLGKFKSAQELQAKNYDVVRRIYGPDHPRSLSAANNLAATYEMLGRPKEAEPLKLSALQTAVRILGDDHINTWAIMGNLANNYRMQGRWNESAELELKVLEARRRLLGPKHSDTLKSMGNLATSYFEQGRTDEALELEKPIAEAMTEQHGPRHPYTLTARNNLAHSLNGVCRRAEAIETMADVVRLRAEVLGPDHVETKRSAGNLARWRGEQRC